MPFMNLRLLTSLLVIGAPLVAPTQLSAQTSARPPASNTAATLTGRPQKYAAPLTVPWSTPAARAPTSKK